MAKTLSAITVGKVCILCLDDTPDKGSGAIAPIGSISLVVKDNIGSQWFKFGAGDTQWRNVSDDTYADIFKNYSIVPFTTANTSETLITSFTLTPNVSGNYLARYILTCSNASNNKTMTASIFRNNVKVAESEMYIINSSANALPLMGECFVTMNGTTDLIDVRIKNNSGTTTITNRVLTMIRRG